MSARARASRTASSARAAGSLRQEARAQARLALPVVLIQIGLLAMGQVDVAFLGRVDAVEVAAAAIGHAVSFVFLIFGMGMLSALDPVISQAFGARDEVGVARGAQRGVLLALALSVPIGLLIWPAVGVLELAGVEPDVVPVARDFVRILIASIPPFLLFVALRQSMQAVHVTRPIVVTIGLANALNGFLDWVLIGGNLGFEPWGARGSAWGTVIARWFMAACLFGVAGRGVRGRLWPPAPRVADARALARMVRLGFPVGLQWTFELGAFAFVAVAMGRIGADELAGHQVTLQLASAAFMVPLGISMAASVRVGNEVGRGDRDAVRRAARVALAAGAGTMALAALAFVALPRPLVRIYVAPDLEPVLRAAVALLPLAALFQVFDGVQVVAAGVLRGLGDTRVPMLLHLAGFWGVALPVGLGLAFPAQLGPRGLWWGLAAGLGAVAVAQFLRLRAVLRRELARVVIDES